MNRPKLPPDVLERMKGYTPFMRKVWLACAEIPAGEVRSYGWIAKRIGRPGASRAVGRALGRNPFAPLVPCHRVVPEASLSGRRVKEGAFLGGYSAPGGLKLKARRLEKEGAFAR